MASLTPIPLPSSIRSRTVDDINGLSMHVLEAGFETRGRPCLLLLHGFPELAYSWRKVMPQLAAAGYHVIAPDQRGYGRTTGWSADYDGDLAPFRFTNLVRDAIGLVSAWLGVGGPLSVVGCAVLGAMFLREAVRFNRTRTDRQARKVLRASLLYLPGALGLLLVDGLFLGW